MKDRAEKFEGDDIMRALANCNVDDIIDDELTRGRIRTIYTQLKYGTKKVYEIAEYYNLPPQLIRDIRDKKICRKITEDL